MDKNPIQQDFLIGATGLANCGIEINLGAGFSAYVDEESDFVSIESGMCMATIKNPGNDN